MKKALVFFVAILLSVGLIGPAFAQRQAPKSTPLPPRATEEPETEQKKSKAKASQSGRKGTKSDASVEERKGRNSARPPLGTEGPEPRQAKKKDASAKPPQSKGAAGPETNKEQKAP